MTVKTIQPLRRSFDRTVLPPGSKSITNRCYVTASLAQGTSRLTGVLESDDTRYMREALLALGVSVVEDSSAHTAVITGAGGKYPSSEADLFLGNSGTSIRFLSAAVVHALGRFRLDGVERMRARPIGDLVTALRKWGVNVDYELNDCFPPVIVEANGLPGGETTVSGEISSQFLSGLMMAAVGGQAESRILVTGPLVSRPYVEMTAAVMRSFGARLELDISDSRTEVIVPGGQSYQCTDYVIEPDASAASYFFAAAAITGSRVRIPGLGKDALQGDVGFVECLQKMGCRVTFETGSSGKAIIVEGPKTNPEPGLTGQTELTGLTGQTRQTGLKGIDVDMHHISDTAQTLGVTALFASGPTTIRNVANMRVKETDRIAALCTELRKFGAQVEEFPDGLRIHPLTPELYTPAVIKTYDDHRMAMSFALAGLRIPGVEIENPECTSKTFPEFFSELEKL